MTRRELRARYGITRRTAAHLVTLCRELEGTRLCALGAGSVGEVLWGRKRSIARPAAQLIGKLQRAGLADYGWHFKLSAVGASVAREYEAAPESAAAAAGRR